MGDNTTTSPPGVTGWPPPEISPIRAMGIGFDALAFLAAILGYCKIAAILILLGLIFNLWDVFLIRRMRRSGPPKGGDSGSGPGTGYSGTGAQGSTSTGTAPGRTDRPDRP